MKPRIKPLPINGDSTHYWVQYAGHGQRVVISGAACAIYGSAPLRLLAQEIELIKARIGPNTNQLAG